jgi:proteasome lid subunit RPN8/RPN11
MANNESGDDVWYEGHRVLGRGSPDPQSFDPSQAGAAAMAAWATKRSRAPKLHPKPDILQELRMTKDVYEKICTIVGKRPAETGGMLLGDPNTYIIDEFVFDDHSDTTGVSYQPNTKFLNKILEGQSERFIGIIHSHPPSCRQLSGQDKRAAWSNLTSPGNPHLSAYLMPIVISKADTGRAPEIIPYIVVCDPAGDGKVQVFHVPLVKDANAAVGMHESIAPSHSPGSFGLSASAESRELSLEPLEQGSKKKTLRSVQRSATTREPRGKAKLRDQ